MEEWLKLTEYNWAFWVAGLFALINFGERIAGRVSKLIEWIFVKKGIETKKMRETREWQERLVKAEKDIEEIKNTSVRNVNMFLEHEQQVVNRFDGIKDEIVAELGKLHDKMEETFAANDKTDCAMLRDRINSGMRYFSQNIGPDGKVHISLVDYENMNALFQEYFAKHGNGAFKKMHDDEFVHFIIDR